MKKGVRNLLVHTDSDYVIAIVRGTMAFANNGWNKLSKMMKRSSYDTNRWLIDRLMAHIQPFGPMKIRFVILHLFNFPCVLNFVLLFFQISLSNTFVVIRESKGMKEPICWQKLLFRTTGVHRA